MVFTLHSIFTHRTAPLWQVLGQTMVNPTSYALEAISGGEPRAAAELVYYMLVDERGRAGGGGAAGASSGAAGASSGAAPSSRALPEKKQSAFLEALEGFGYQVLATAVAKPPAAPPVPTTDGPTAAEAETAAAAAAAVRPSLSALTPVRAPIQLPDIKIDVISAKPRLVGTVLAAFNALDDLGDLCALAQACWERAMRLRPRLLSRVHELQDGPHVRPPTPTLTLLVPHLFS